MLGIADRIDRLNAAIGRAAAWLVLVVVLVELAVILFRHVLGLGSIWLNETVVYAHAGVFMLAAAWTLLADKHVRVDVFYAEASPRRKAWIDLLGALLLLLPFMAVLGYLAIPYVMRSWAILERSRETSGLPLVYLLKTLIPLFALLLGLQGVAQAIRAAWVLTGNDVGPSRELGRTPSPLGGKGWGEGATYSRGASSPSPGSLRSPTSPPRGEVAPHARQS